MKIAQKASSRLLTMILLGSTLLTGSGCQDIEVSEVYNKALFGALVGVIVGHQSDEDGAGAAVGATIFGVGELLEQIDANKTSREVSHYHETCDEVSDPAPVLSQGDKITIHITNSNGSTTPVELNRKDGFYVGPKDELYQELPTEEQLKAIYGF